MGCIDIGDYQREYHEHGEIVIRAKWAIDGAETLEASSRSRSSPIAWALERRLPAR